MSDPARVARIQAAVGEEGVSAWLLFDFHGTNPIARRVLGCDRDPHASKTTRRWFYLVPASGEPVKLVHRLEPGALGHLPGRTRVYLTWQELERSLAEVIGALGGAGAPVVAMEYSESARLPYVSRVDAGTVELAAPRGRASPLRPISPSDSTASWIPPPARTIAGRAACSTGSCRPRSSTPVAA